MPITGLVLWGICRNGGISRHLSDLNPICRIVSRTFMHGSERFRKLLVLSQCLTQSRSIGLKVFIKLSVLLLELSLTRVEVPFARIKALLQGL